jgi:hypothetical protein
MLPVLASPVREAGTAASFYASGSNAAAHSYSAISFRG